MPPRKGQTARQGHGQRLTRGAVWGGLEGWAELAPEGKGILAEDTWDQRRGGWRTCGYVGEIREASGQPQPSSSETSSRGRHLRPPPEQEPAPPQANHPPRPICSSTAGTDTGIWQLRPRRTHRARSWHRGSATCQRTFPASRAQLSGICQVPAPWVAVAGPRPAVHRPAGGLPAQALVHNPARWAASASTHSRGSRRPSRAPRVGHFLPNYCFSSASGLRSAGEEFPRGPPPRTWQHPGKAQIHGAFLFLLAGQ